MKIPLIGKVGNRKEPQYLKWASQLPCVCTGSYHNVVLHHLLRGVDRGMGMKAADRYVIPLTHEIHAALHAHGNETEYLKGWGVHNPVAIADTLYACYRNGDLQGAISFIYELHE